MALSYIYTESSKIGNGLKIPQWFIFLSICSSKPISLISTIEENL